MLKLAHMCIFVVVTLLTVCDAVVSRGSQSYCENGKCVLTEEEFKVAMNDAYKLGRTEEKEACRNRVQACQVIDRKAGGGPGSTEEYYKVQSWILDMDAYNDHSTVVMKKVPEVGGNASQYYEVNVESEIVKWLSKSGDLLKEMAIGQESAWSDQVGIDKSGVSIIEALRSGKLNVIAGGGHYAFPSAGSCQ